MQFVGFYYDVNAKDLYTLNASEVKESVWFVGRAFLL